MSAFACGIFVVLFVDACLEPIHDSMRTTAILFFGAAAVYFGIAWLGHG